MKTERRTRSEIRVLVVDDEPDIRELLNLTLVRMGLVADCVGSVTEAKHLLEKSRYQLCLTDMRMPDGEGLDLVRHISEYCEDLPVAVITAHGSMENAISALKAGAFDYLAKPVSLDQLRVLVKSAIGLPARSDDNATSAANALVGNSPAMSQVRAMIERVARSQAPVYISGESGSGKELAAAALHRLSDRAAKPDLALNCAAISPSLVEATLFGHSKGAFTGASGSRAGYFEDASDGTLFLDEIGELPLDLQPKLLRVLENGEFQRIGETQARHSSARIIAATNRDLKKEVREGRFRADLYHRLSVFTIAIPALRELGNDSIRLLEHFRAIYAAQANLPPFRLGTTAAERLLAYGFPGNVRELRNIAIRLTTKFADKEVGADELEAELDPGDAPQLAGVLSAPTSASRAELVAIALGDIQSRRDFNLDATLRLWEEAYIEAAQRLAHDNMSQAARLLGVNRTTLYNRIDMLERVTSAPPRMQRPD